MWEEESLHALLNDDEPDAAVAQDELGTALPPEGKPEDFSIVPREDHPEDLRIAPREDNPEDKPRYEYVVTMRPNKPMVTRSLVGQREDAEPDVCSCWEEDEDTGMAIAVFFGGRRVHHPWY